MLKINMLYRVKKRCSTKKENIKFLSMVLTSSNSKINEDRVQYFVKCGIISFFDCFTTILLNHFFRTVSDQFLVLIAFLM